MPVITNEQAPEPRRRRGRALWLLLVPPGLALGLLLAAAFQPLQIGPLVLAADVERAPGFGWRSRFASVSRPPSPAIPLHVRGQDYVLTGGGQVFALGLGDWVCGALWFHGHRQRPTRP